MSNSEHNRTSAAFNSTGVSWEGLDMPLLPIPSQAPNPNERRITVGGYQPVGVGNPNPPGAFEKAITDTLKVAVPPTKQVRLRRWNVFIRDTWASASTEFNRDIVRYFDANTPQETVRTEIARRLGKKLEDVVIESDDPLIMA